MTIVDGDSGDEVEGVEEPDRRGGDFGLPLDGGDGRVLMVKNLIAIDTSPSGHCKSLPA